MCAEILLIGDDERACIYCLHSYVRILFQLILQPLPYPSFKFNENRQMFSPGNIVIIIGVVVATMIMTLSIILINDVIEEKESGVKVNSNELEIGIPK